MIFSKQLILLTIIAATCLLTITIHRDENTKTKLYHVARKAFSYTGTLDTSPKLIWLLAYPFTGSRVTIKIVQDISGKSCATNYGHEYITNWDDSVKNRFDSVPISYNAPNGPFKQHFQLDLPELESTDFILTRTYCGGYCMEDGSVSSCGLSAYAQYLANPAFFLKACASGTRYSVDGKMYESTMYNVNRVKKAVILVRNPLETIVSRFCDLHGATEDYPLNREGFEDWCASYDAQPGTQQLKKYWYFDNVKAAAEGTPCHGEFWRMAKWYNQAFKTMDVMGNDVLVIKFEDYETSPEEAVDDLFDFIGLDKQDNYTIPFKRKAKEIYHWRHWFTADEVERIRMMFNEVADSRTRIEFEDEWPAIEQEYNTTVL